MSEHLSETKFQIENIQIHNPINFLISFNIFGVLIFKTSFNKKLGKKNQEEQNARTHTHTGARREKQLAPTALISRRLPNFYFIIGSLRTSQRRVFEHTQTYRNRIFHISHRR